MRDRKQDWINPLREGMVEERVVTTRSVAAGRLWDFWCLMSTAGGGDLIGPAAPMPH